ncbi:MAG: hypothetical protein ACLR56_12915 [Oscillospiraceae bacterium]
MSGVIPQRFKNAVMTNRWNTAVFKTVTDGTNFYGYDTRKLCADESYRGLAARRL